MISNIRRYKNLINNFQKLPLEIRDTILQSCCNQFTNLIAEICLNIQNLNISITRNQRKSLSKYKKLIKSMCCKKVSKSKKNKIIQKGGSLIPLLFSIAAPFINQMLS